MAHVTAGKSIGSSECDWKFNQKFAKREGLKPKLNYFVAQKLSNLGLMLNKLMQLKRVTDRGLGAEPQLAGQFL